MNIPLKKAQEIPNACTASGPSSKMAVAKNAPPAKVPPKQSHDVFAPRLLIGKATKPPTSPAAKRKTKRSGEITFFK
jgi:hypothetical protein